VILAVKGLAKGAIEIGLKVLDRLARAFNVFLAVDPDLGRDGHKDLGTFRSVVSQGVRECEVSV